MNLPKFGRGFELVSSQLNKLSDAIRRATITSVIGGTMTVTPGGTTLIIDQQPRGGGGGTSAPCPAQVTDASDNTTIKVQVATFLVQNRYPDGMSLDGPPFLLTLTETCYIFCKLVYVENDVILAPENTAITVMDSATLEENTVNDQYVLLASVIIADGRITRIDNICQPVVPDPCQLKWN